jgi:hypothetical protein
MPRGDTFSAEDSGGGDSFPTHIPSGGFMGPISVSPQAGGHMVGCLIGHMALHRIILTE